MGDWTSPARQSTCQQDVVVAIIPPADAPPDGWFLENGDLLPETSVHSGALACAILSTTSMVKSRGGGSTKLFYSRTGTVT